jgi:hypothetical protein
MTDPLAQLPISVAAELRSIDVSDVHPAKEEAQRQASENAHVPAHHNQEFASGMDGTVKRDGFYQQRMVDTEGKPRSAPPVPAPASTPSRLWARPAQSPLN